MPPKEKCFTVANEATEQIARYFDSDGVKPHVERLLNTWNDAELLGSVLADQLREFAEEQMTKANINASLDEVDWNELADHYAETVGVDEDELQRRYEKYRNGDG